MHIDARASEHSSAVTIHRLLSADEDFIRVAETEFPKAFGFYLVESETFGKPTDEGKIIDGSARLIGMVKYDAKNDCFVCEIDGGSQKIELTPDDIILNPETRVPYFECPQTTYHGGTKRGDEMLTARQLAELETGRSTTLREGQAGKPAARPS